jgi:hypothetical protein
MKIGVKKKKKKKMDQGRKAHLDDENKKFAGECLDIMKN